MAQWAAFQEWREGQGLRHAASTGDVDFLRLRLAKGPPIDEYDNSGLTLLHMCAAGPPDPIDSRASTYSLRRAQIRQNVPEGEDGFRFFSLPNKLILNCVPPCSRRAPRWI